MVSLPGTCSGANHREIRICNSSKFSKYSAFHYSLCFNLLHVMTVVFFIVRKRGGGAFLSCMTTCPLQMMMVGGPISGLLGQENKKLC